MKARLTAVLILTLAFWSGGASAKDIEAPRTDKAMSDYKNPSDEELKKLLTPEQYHVARQCGTEPPFKNAYWDNHAEGIYVDVVSGEPLFSSKDKFDSGTGWPSFTRPLEPGNIVTKTDKTLWMTRIEARSKHGDSHLGHVFDDGPAPTGKRYCMNSASLRFVPKDQLEAEGYGRYLALFAAGAAAGERTSPRKGSVSEAHKGAGRREVVELAGGCFWGMQEILRKIPGVLHTEAGYIGGTTSNPGYEAVHSGATGHAEAVQVTFDPDQLPFERLLRWFFRMHDPTTLDRQGNDVGASYRSAIFYHTDEERRIAEAVKARVDKNGHWGAPLVTQIVKAGPFYKAEEMHQDYLQKHPKGYTCHFLRPESILGE